MCLEVVPKVLGGFVEGGRCCVEGGRCCVEGGRGCVEGG